MSYNTFRPSIEAPKVTAMKIKLNYDDSIPVTRDIFWVGFYDRVTHFHCNPYILVDEQDVIIFDPGSIPDFPEIMRKVIDVINPNDVTYIVASHQDPDVCGNLAVTEDIIGRDDLKIVAHEYTIRLIQHLGLKSDFYAIDAQHDKLVLKSGRVLEFMATPYLHAPGAMVTFDTKTRSLFSSDLFGGVSPEWELYAGDWDYLSGMKTFHQHYMPTQMILKPALEKIQARWDIDRILPQHGCILEGEHILRSFDFLKNLPCGIDLDPS